ncbi:hypothetical protein D3C75_1188990 [compost metagenome]
MEDRVLDNRLKNQLNDGKREKSLRHGNIQHKFVREADLEQMQIIPHMVQFMADRDHLFTADNAVAHL